MTAVAFLAAMAIAGPGSAQEAGYLDFDGLTAQLQSVANGSQIASLSSIGESHDGRDIWMLEIADPAGTPVNQRPGVLIVGNLEGDHLVGSHLALETARYLVAGTGGTVQALQDHVFYIVPRLNPDGAEAMFAGILSDRRTNGRPFDDDNDGRVDEDGPEDLNGDGFITVMRVPDPLGDLIVSGDDDRFLVEADPTDGTAGQYTVFWEGVDSDGDGFINEDGPGGVDLNRNFQHEYPYYGMAAGPHMVSEPEARALIDFAISRRNIGAVLTFGHTDNLVTPPNGGGSLTGPTWPSLEELANESNAGVFNVGVYASGSATGGLSLRGAQPGADNDPDSGQRPAVTVASQDVAYFAAVSDLYREITGIERVVANRTAGGAFFQYGYFHFGVPSFSTQGWPAAEPDGDGDAAILSSLGAGAEDAFIPWSDFDHPELGRVEIGGFRPYSLTNPPAADLAGLGASHGEFAVRLAGLLPRVQIVSTEVEAHGGGLFTVTAEVANTGYLPTALQHGVRARSVAPVTVQIQVDADDILTGDPKTNSIPRMEGSTTVTRFSWLIRGTAGSEVEIQARSQKSGNDAAMVTLGGGR